MVLRGWTVDDHVEPFRHMATDALRTSARLVMMVAGRVVRCFSQTREGRIPIHIVTLRTNRIAIGNQASRMWVVTIATAYTPCIHFRLEKGAKHIDLVQDLTVGVIEPIAQKREAVTIGEKAPGRRTCIAKRPSSRMAGRALLDFGFWIVVGKIGGEAELINALPIGRFEIRWIVAPGEVCLTGSVAGFATDSNFGLTA